MNQKKEVWLPIKGYVGFYEISNLGRVKSLKRTANVKNGGFRTVKEKILKQEVVIGNYRRVLLRKNGNGKRFAVHRLVAFHFLKEDKNRLFVNHIDKNPSNNKVENLEWVNRRENQTHASLNCSNNHYAVHYMKNQGDYQVSIFYNGVKNYLGTFKSIKKAVEIRDKFIKEKQIINKYIC